MTEDSDDGWEAPTPGDEDAQEGLDDAVQVVLQSAHELGDEGDFQGMAERLREGLQDHPGDPYLNCWLGVAEQELGLAGVAYERFRACLAARPTDPLLLATAGNGIAAFDDPEALGALRSAALLGPDLPVARWLYGGYLIREGLLEEGLAELIAARDLDPDDGGIRYELGVGLALAGRRAQAVDELFRSIDLEAGDGWAHVVLGLLLSDEGRAEEAAGVLEEGARLRADDVEAQLLASLAAAAIGNDETAFEMLERARQWAEGIDRGTVDEVESRLDEGAEESAAWLAEQLGPAALRERMMIRP